jgi:two-component system chemotaxis response regulator CheY
VGQGLAELRILLVDDNAHMRAIVAAILKSADVVHVREASDGGQALRALKDWPADIAIVDLQMAPMDGLEFTRRLRKPDSPNPFLPIIMMTGYAEQAKVIEARDAGVNEFLVKPITAKGVLDRMNAAVFKPRDFVQSERYFGPTRRRAARPGPRRRATDADPRDD